MTRQSLGAPGALGFLVLIVWAIGWLVLGWDDGAFHVLLPVGIVLMLAQVARRLVAS
jgi:hypothetical protein